MLPTSSPRPAKDQMSFSQELVCFGLSYTAEALARRLRPKGWRIWASARTQDRAEAIAAQGVTPFRLDFETELPRAAHWLVSAPPGETGCPVFEAVGQQAGLAGSISYLSTTGVYGDQGGAWVYEDTPIHPTSPEAVRRAMAERQWAGLGASIFRLPGIYGPMRSVLDRLRAGTAQAFVKPGQVFSRIHVDDIASGLEAAILLEKPIKNRVFHLCDDEPAAPQDVLWYAADLLGVPRPEPVPFEQADLSPMARRFYSECKRVSNAHTKQYLEWAPTYPTYREGLAATLRSEAVQFDT